MNEPMRRRLIVSLFLTVGITTSQTGSALATNLNTTPLPREREAKDFQQSNELVPSVSRFHRRLDYREEDKAKAEEQEQAQRQALENAARARSEQAMGAKKRSDEAILANNKGVSLGQQRRWVEAIAAHEQAVQCDPANKQFRINLSAARTAYGQDKLSSGDLNSAANLFRKALAAAADNGMAGKLLVETMKKQGKDPNNVDLRLDIGDQLASVGDLEAATVEYQAAMTLESSARTYVKMGDMALRYGQAATASNWFRQAVAKDASYGPAYRQLGLLELAQRDFTGAAASLRKALVLDPKDAAAGQTLVEIWRRQVAANPLLAENHLGLAGALQLTGDFLGAEGEYRKLEALDPKNSGLELGRVSLQRAIQHAEAERHKDAADTLYGQGLHREALAEVSRAVSMEPNNSKYQFLFAECLESTGDYNNAHQAYMKCVQIDPVNNREAAARMKEMQRSLGNRLNVPAPQQQMQQGMAMAPQGQMPMQQQQQMQMQMQGQAPQQMQMQGQAPQQMPVQMQQQGQPNAAGNAFQQQQPPRAQAPADTAFNDAMAHVTDMEASKKYEEAIALLRQVVSANLQSAEVHHRLAVDLLALGQVSEAISEFRIASALRPEKKEYATDLASALAIHKRSQEAESAPAMDGQPGSKMASTQEGAQ
jgi:tetratricopeptide (TPR) repeat protein